MKKFKSYSFMMGLISAILMVIVQILAAFDIYISNEMVSNIVSVILGGLVVLGVVNKPKDDEQISDVNIPEENNDNSSSDNENN